MLEEFFRLTWSVAIQQLLLVNSHSERVEDSESYAQQSSIKHAADTCTPTPPR